MNNGFPVKISRVRYTFGYAHIEQTYVTYTMGDKISGSSFIHRYHSPRIYRKVETGERKLSRMVPLFRWGYEEDS